MFSPTSILGGVLILLVVARKFEGKSLSQNNVEDQQMKRSKRGYSKYGENDFGTSVHVSSGVLHFSQPQEHGTLDISNSYDHSPWKPSGPPPGYEIWLDPTPSHQPSLPHDISTTSISSVHSSDSHIPNDVFSTDTHWPSVELTHNDGLHTHITSSSDLDDGDIDIGQHDVVPHISDNVDFSNVAHLKSKHYAKSYGK